jgi:hypothetical protein
MASLALMWDDFVARSMDWMAILSPDQFQHLGREIKGLAEGG